MDEEKEKEKKEEKVEKEAASAKEKSKEEKEEKKEKSATKDEKVILSHQTLFLGQDMPDGYLVETNAFTNVHFWNLPLHMLESRLADDIRRKVMDFIPF